jgi:hypothetical protein
MNLNQVAEIFFGEAGCEDFVKIEILRITLKLKSHPHGHEQYPLFYVPQVPWKNNLSSLPATVQVIV